MRESRKTGKYLRLPALTLACVSLVVSLSVGVGFHAFIVLVEPAAGEARLLVEAAPIDSVAARPAGHLPTPNKTPRRQISAVASASEIWREILTARQQNSCAPLAEPYHSRVILS